MFVWTLWWFMMFGTWRSLARSQARALLIMMKKAYRTHFWFRILFLLVPLFNNPNDRLPFIIVVTCSHKGFGGSSKRRCNTEGRVWVHGVAEGDSHNINVCAWCAFPANISNHVIQTQLTVVFSTSLCCTISAWISQMKCGPKLLVDFRFRPRRRLVRAHSLV